MTTTADCLSDAAIHSLLSEVESIAVVGASANPDRPSFKVMAALVAHGYAVHPINPGLAGQSIHGQPVVATISGCAAPVDIIDIFRNSQAAGAVVDEAIALKDSLAIRAVWMQIGVINEAAADRARAAGLIVVMDRCPKIELARLGLAPRTARPPK